jgi:hypothetical protein
MKSYSPVRAMPEPLLLPDFPSLKPLKTLYNLNNNTGGEKLGNF